MKLRSLLLALLFLAGLPAPASAHSFKPGLLSADELAPGRFALRWKAPTHRGRPVPGVSAHFPGHCAVEEGPAGPRLLDCGEAGLVGGIEVRGLRASSAGVLLRIGFLDGAVQTEILHADLPQTRVEPAPEEASSEIESGWLGVGVQHIWMGPDHLLFVLGLVILVVGMKRLLWTVTAFTLAHSITLAASALGALSLPGPPVEAVIALSIVLLAWEILRDRPGLTRDFPWLVAFCFGLLHGFGFAGALLEMGLPREGAAWALLLFNLGVELGQLCFVAVVLLPVLALRRAPMWLQRIPAYGMGAVAVAWTLGRVASFWG